MTNIFLGPAGSPKTSTLEGVKAVRKLKLNAMEVEFVYGVRMDDELAKKVGEVAKKEKIRLSVHAPYYINLCSFEKQKIGASKGRILQSCRRAHYMGADYVVFHAGYYQGRDKEEIYQRIKKEIKYIMNEVKTKAWKKVIVAPETTGKGSQFGDLDELLRLRKETKCGICIDFAHLYARNNGVIDYKEIFSKLRKAKLKHLHCHFSGIEYTEKGERRHLVMDKEFFKPLAKEIKKWKGTITIISESPVTWQDSLKMKKVLGL